MVGCCGSVPEPVKLHLLAHELMHLQLESEAREAGKLADSPWARSTPGRTSLP